MVLGARHFDGFIKIINETGKPDFLLLNFNNNSKITLSGIQTGLPPQYFEMSEIIKVRTNSYDKKITLIRLLPMRHL